MLFRRKKPIKQKIVWYEALYCSKTIKSLPILKAKISKKIKVNKIYCIVASHNRSNLVELVPYRFLFNNNYEELKIIGLCKSRHEGLDLIEDIVRDIYIENNEMLLKFIKTR